MASAALRVPAARCSWIIVTQLQLELYIYLLILHISMSSCQGQGCGGTLLLVLHGARSMCDVCSRNTAAVEVLRSMNRLHHSPHQPRARPQTPAPSRTTAVKCKSHPFLQLHNITSHHSVIFLVSSGQGYSNVVVDRYHRNIRIFSLDREQLDQITN